MPKINYQVGFNADATNLVNSLRTAQESLSKISTLSTGLPLTEKMQEAALAAQQLEQHLKNAYNQQTGKLDLSIFSNSLKQSGVTLQQYATQLAGIGSVGRQAFFDVSSAIAKAELPLKRTSKLFDSLWISMKNTMKWQLTSSAMHGFLSAVSTAFGYTKSLNASLNSIQIVTRQSSEEMAAFAENANKAAKALSTTTTDYTNASLIYYQQGLSDKEVEERTNETIKFANVSNESTQAASEQLTAIWNNFADGSKKLSYYIDVMTALGAATASSSQEISTGIQKFASVADTIGLSYEYAAASLATITATTRESADIVGTALRTLYSRIQGLSLGETLEDGTDLNKYSQALASVGISIKDTNGDLKDMDSIIDELGNKWKTLGEDQQMALAQTVAGVRQYTQLITLMENYDFFKENLQIAYGSEGTLEQQAQIYAESWEAARDRVKAATEDIYDSIIDSQTFINIDNVLTPFLTGIAKSIDALGGLKGILTAIVYTMTTIYSDRISQGIRDMAYNMSLHSGEVLKQQREIQAAAVATAEALAAQQAASEAKEERSFIRDTDVNAKTVALQIELNQRAKDFSTEQYEQIQGQIQLTEAIGKSVVEMDNLRKESEKAATVIAENLEGAQYVQGQRSGLSTLQRALKGQQKIKDKENKEEISITGLVNNEALKAIDRLAKMPNKGIAQAFDLSGATQAFQELNSYSASITQLILQFQKLSDDTDVTSEKVKQLADAFKQLTGKELDITTIDTAMKQLQEESQMSEATIKRLQSILTNKSGFQLAEKDVKAFAEAARIAGENSIAAGLGVKTFDTKVEELRAVITGAKTNMGDFATTIVSVARGLANLGMAMQAVSSIGELISDEDLTFGQKFIQVLTRISMLIPTVTMAISTYKTLLDQTRASSLRAAIAQSAQAASTALAGTAAGTAAPGVAALAGAVNALLGPIMLLVTVGGIAAVVIGQIVDAVTTTPEEAKEAIEKTTQSLEEATSAVESLRSELESLQEQLEELQDIEAPTLAEQEEIDKLKEEVGLLEQQLDLKERIAKIEQVANAKTIEQNLDKSTQFLKDYEKVGKISKVDVFGQWHDDLDEWYEIQKQSVYYEEDLIKLDQEYLEAIEQAQLERANFVSENKDDIQTLLDNYQTYLQAGIDNPEFIEHYKQVIKEALMILYEGNEGQIQEIFIKPVILKEDFDNVLQDFARTNRVIISDSMQEDLDNAGVLTEDFINYVERVVKGAKGNISTLFKDIVKGREFFESLSNEEIELIARMKIETPDDFQGLSAGFMQDLIDGKYDLTILSQIDWEFIYQDGMSLEDAIKKFYEEEAAKAQATMDSFSETSFTLRGVLQTYQDEEDLDDDQMDFLDQLTQKYEQLGELQRGNNHEYLQALREIQEIEEENEKNRLQGIKETQRAKAAQLQDELNRLKKMRGSTSEEAQELKVAISAKTDELDKTLDDIANTDHELKVTIKTDFDTDVEQAFGIANEIEQLGNYVAEDLEITFDRAQEIIAAGYGAMLINAQETANSTILLDKEVMNSFIDDKQAELEADRQSKIAQLENEKILVETKMAYIQAALDAIDVGLESQDASVKAQALADASYYMAEADAKKITEEDKIEYTNQANIKMEAATEKLVDSLGLLHKQDAENLQQANKDAETSTNQLGESMVQVFNSIGETVANLSAAISQMANGEEVAYTPGSAVSASNVSVGASTPGSAKGNYSFFDKTIDQIKRGIEEVLGGDLDQANAALNAAKEKGLASLAAEKDKYGALDSGIAALKSATLSLDTKQAGAGTGSGSKKSGKEKEPKVYDKEDLKTLEEIEDRYHEITREILRQDDLLDDIGNLQERVYGASKLKKYRQELVALEKQLENYREKLREAQFRYLPLDTARLEQLFDNVVIKDNGELADYEGLLNQTITRHNEVLIEYNKFIDEINTLTAEEQEAREDEIEAWKLRKEAADAEQEARLAALKQYEDTRDVIQEMRDSIEENLRAIADNKLSQVEYRLEIILDVKSMRDAIREFDKKVRGIFSDELFHGIPVGDVAKDQAQAEADMYPVYKQQYNDLVDLYNSTDIQMDRDRIIQDIIDLQGKVLDSAEAIVDWVNSIEDIIPAAVSAAKERYDIFLNQLEHNTTITDTIRELYALQGVTYKTLSGFNMLQRASQEKMEAQVAEAELQKAWYEEARLKLQQAQADLDSLNGDENNLRYDTYKKARDAYLAEFNEAQEAYLSLAKDAMETAQEMYLEQIDRAVYKFGQAVSGGIGLDLLQDKYDHYIEEDSRYLDKFNEAYETTAWYNKLQADIDKTNNAAQKERLKRLQEEIDIRREGNKLSQYDLDILNAKYEVLQAQMALEDAQNAKNQLQLVRDEQGNWNYQYTANPDDIADAETGVLKAENEWYNIAKQQVADVTGEIISSWIECKDKISEVYQDMTLTDEERANRAQEIYEYYTKKIKYLEEEKQVAISDMTEAGNQGLFHAAVQMGDKLTDLTGLTSENIQDLVKVTGASVNELLAMDGKQIQEVINQYNQAIEGSIKDTTGNIVGYVTSNGEIVTQITDENAATIVGAITETGQYIEGIVNENGEFIIEQSDDIGNGVLNSTNNFGNDFVDSLGNTYEKMKDIFDENGKVVDSFDNVFANDLDNMTKNTANFGDILANTLDEAQNDFENYGDTVGKIGDTTGTTLEDLNYIIEETSDSTDILRDSGIEAAEMLWDMIDATHEAVYGYLDLAESIWEAVEALRELAEAQADFVERQTEKDVFDYDENYAAVAAKYIQSGGQIGDETWNEIKRKAYQKMDYLEQVEQSDQSEWRDRWENDLESWIYNPDLAYEGWSEIDVEKYGQNWKKRLEEILAGISGFDTGGFTGDFSDAKLAFLHEKELVLNARDTENILSAVNMLRGNDLFASIERTMDGIVGSAMQLMSDRLGDLSVKDVPSQFDQTIHIDEVVFPNATSSSEISDAFASLANDALQWARRRTE